jgi:uroporphyrinogen-III synthase
MQTPRILITRPEPGASRTAGRLREAGYEPVVLPLTRIERLNFEIPDGPFDAVVLTSAQALDGVHTAPFASLPMIVVGDMTAKAAGEAGFTRIQTASGSAESVAALAVSTFKPHSRLLYLCGKVRRPELESLLGEAGFIVTAVETYNAAPIDHEFGNLSAIIDGKPFDAVILMSAVTAELFGNYADKPQFRDSLLVCFSQRIAAVASLRGSRITVTDEATEGSLMSHLKTRFEK